MTGKKRTAVKPAEKKTSPLFTKSNILQAEQYVTQRDLLAVLLENEKTYSKEEIEKKIKEFQKGKVR